MRGLDDVVLGSPSAAGSRRGRPRERSAREVLAPGEQLVHVRLVAGVEDDRRRSASRRPGGSRSSARRRRGSARGARRCVETFSTRNSRISAASCSSCSGSARRDRGVLRWSRSKRHPCLRFEPPAADPSRVYAGHSDAGQTSRRPVELADRSERAVLRRASAARTAGCRRCGSSPPHRACRCARPRRTRRSPCRRAENSLGAA